jgi:dihydroorotate dehydrogenase electron transfer subunit
MIQEKARIIEHEPLTINYYLLTLYSEHIAANAKPGQFVSVKVSDELEPLLKRPISVHQVDREKGSFKLLYEILGPGTKALATRKPGEVLNILGPLGSGFNLNKGTNLLVAGGMGIAPLTFLANEAVKSAKDLHIFIGSKTKNFVLLEDHFRALGAHVHVATEDGSLGEKGLVTTLLTKVLATHTAPTTTIYTCGPKAMLKEISRIAKEHNVPCQVSTEAYMACGIGACKGCAVETVGGYKMACKDGPVFNAEELKW